MTSGESTAHCGRAVEHAAHSDNAFDAARAEGACNQLIEKEIYVYCRGAQRERPQTAFSASMLSMFVQMTKELSCLAVNANVSILVS